VHRVTSAAQVKSVFLELNKAESVLEVDLPDSLAPPARRTIQEAVALLQEGQPAMFKPSARCRPPHVNAAVLRDALFRSRLVQMGQVGNASQLLALMQGANSRLAQKRDVDWQVRLRGAGLKKARVHSFFLGLDLNATIAAAEELAM
jgi:hypothetical protein